MTAWIGRPKATLHNWESKVLPAPHLRRCFDLKAAPKRAELRICGIGYYELHLNGTSVGDQVLDPIVTQYDKRVRYVTHDVTESLRAGANAIGVILGNGWYNCFTSDAWHFDRADWRDYPKLWLELDGELENGESFQLRSDPDWKVGDGPIRFDGLRNGETYDAREEIADWDTVGFDDSAWSAAAIVAGPGGLLEPQNSPPCKVMETLPAASVRVLDSGAALFDIGQNIAGWARIRVSGPAGTELVLRYAEKLNDAGELDPSNIDTLVFSGDVQTDRYILKGEGEEVWEPRFTYHGFRYVEVTGWPGTPSPEMLDGRVVYTSFDTVGDFTCSSDAVNTLQTATKWSYIGNFVGIPTDCPHREKNGWTGDAQLACETGLMNYDAGSSYRQWLQTMADTQRPSGQFPGIVPSAGWGYNWGSGPAWDAAYVLIPGYIHLYTGDDTAIREHYDGIRRYLDFCATMATDDLLSFGLGDWCSAKQEHPVPAALTSTAYYYVFLRNAADYARLLGREADAEAYDALAARVHAAFNATFYRGGGQYHEGQATSLGCALYQGLVAPEHVDATVQRLVERVEAQDGKADFGILGAKYITRTLADHGRADLAYRIITQPESPGWIHWLDQGATTLWEDWGGKASRNHIMFGDISAWFFSTLAGIRPDPEAPGFEHVIMRPQCLPELTHVEATHRGPRGLVRSAWRRDGDRVAFEIDLPEGSRGTFRAGAETRELAAGEHRFALSSTA